MILTADEAVVRALLQDVSNPAAIRARQAWRDDFADRLLALVELEDGEPPVERDADATIGPAPRE